MRRGVRSDWNSFDVDEKTGKCWKPNKNCPEHIRQLFKRTFLEKKYGEEDTIGEKI